MERTPHWTDGKGIGKKLTGERLTKRLDELRDTVNRQHSLYQQHQTSMLQAARAAGDALLEAKRRLGHRSKWRKWRRRNFPHLSDRTLRVYMQVARHWDDQRVKDYRRSSVNQFIKALKAKPTDAHLLPKQLDRRRQLLLIKRIKQAVAYELTLLDHDELQALHDNFDALWSTIDDHVRHVVELSSRI